MPTINISLDPTRLAQVVLGGAAVVGGYKAASSMIRTAYREDLLGDPTRVIELDDRTMIYQTREPQGAKLTNYLLGAGAASAFIGSALALSNPGVTAGVPAALRNVGGAALFALGIGAIAGAASMAAQYSGADFAPVR